MTLVCFFGACRSGNLLHSFGHFQLDHHRGGILVSLPTDGLEDVKVPGFHDAIQLAGYDPTLCLLALRRSQEDDWSRYVDDDPPFFGYDSMTGLVYDIPRLRANKRFKTGSSIIVDFASHEFCWLCELQLASMQSCKSEWL